MLAEMVTTHPNALLDVEQAAQYLRLTPNTLRKWRYQKRGPRWVAIKGPGGKHHIVRYRGSDLIAWLDTQVVDPCPRRRRGRPRKTASEIVLKPGAELLDASR